MDCLGYCELLWFFLDRFGSFRIILSFKYNSSGPILESEGMRAIFQKKGKFVKLWAKMYKNRKYFEKGQVIACDIAIN